MVKLFGCCCAVLEKNFYVFFTMFDVVLNLLLIGFSGYLFRFQVKMNAVIMMSLTLIYVLWEINLYCVYRKEQNYNTFGHKFFAIIRLLLSLCCFAGFYFMYHGLRIMLDYQGNNKLKCWAVLSSITAGGILYSFLNLHWSWSLLKIVRKKKGTYEESEIMSEDYDD